MKCLELRKTNTARVYDVHQLNKHITKEIVVLGNSLRRIESSLVCEPSGVQPDDHNGASRSSRTGSGERKAVPPPAGLPSPLEGIASPPGVPSPRGFGPP